MNSVTISWLSNPYLQVRPCFQASDSHPHLPTQHRLLDASKVLKLNWTHDLLPLKNWCSSLVLPCPYHPSHPTDLKPWKWSSPSPPLTNWPPSSVHLLNDTQEIKSAPSPQPPLYHNLTEYSSMSCLFYCCAPTVLSTSTLTPLQFILIGRPDLYACDIHTLMHMYTYNIYTHTLMHTRSFKIFCHLPLLLG